MMNRSVNVSAWNEEYNQQLAQLRTEFSEIEQLPPQKRGYDFEKFIINLLKISGLNAMTPFRNKGEQIDGSFLLDNNVFLIEAKWREEKTGISDIAVLNFKANKTVWTRGLFISLAGFSDKGQESYSSGNAMSLICMDGQDLRFILDGNLTFRQSILIKLFDAGMTKKSFEPLWSLKKKYPDFIETLEKEFINKISIDSYKAVLAGFPKGIEHSIEKYINSELITEDGNRKYFPLASGHSLKEYLEKLVELGVLIKTKQPEGEYVKIGNDALLPAIKKSRDRKNRTKKKIFSISGILLALVLIGLTVFTFYQKSRADEQLIIANLQNKNAEVNLLASKALLELRNDNTRAIRIAGKAYKMGEPNPPAITYRALSATGYSSFEEPFYITTIECGALIRSAVYSPDSKMILVALDDGTAELWDLNKKKLLFKIKHDKRIMSAAFSPKGERILTASWDKRAALWNLDGVPLPKFEHNSFVYDAKFSPDGKRVVTALRSGCAALWNLAGESLPISFEIKHNDRMRSAVFSSEGTRLLTSSEDETAKLWSMEGVKLAEFRHEKTVVSAVFSTDDSHVLTASHDHTAKLWDLKNKEESQPVIFLHNGKVASAVFSPNGDKILTASHDRTAKLWDLHGRILRELRHSKPVYFAEFSPNGKELLTACEDGTIKRWSLESKLVVALKGEVDKTAFSPDGSLILTISRFGTANLWDLEGNSCGQLIGQGFIDTAVFSPNGKRILTISDKGKTDLWDSRGVHLKEFKYMDSATFSPKGEHILTVSREGTAKVWASENKESVDLNRDGGIVNKAVFSPNGKRILAIFNSGAVKVWDIAGNFLGALLESDKSVGDAAFSPDSKKVLVTFMPIRTVSLWEPKKKHTVDLELEEAVLHALFSPNGDRVLTVCKDGTAKVWNLKGNSIFNLNEQSVHWCSSAFSHDGTQVLLASYNDHATLWDLKNKETFKFIHKDKVNTAIFSPNGQQVLTASKDGTAKVWDLKGNLLADLNKHNGEVTSAVFLSNAQRILTTSSDGTVKVWYTPKAIYKWLKKANIPGLPEENKENRELKKIEGVDYNGKNI